MAVSDEDEAIISDVMERLAGYSPCIQGPIPAPDLDSDQIELHIIMSKQWLEAPTVDDHPSDCLCDAHPLETLLERTKHL